METLGAQATTDKNAAESAKEAAEAAANDATIALCGYPSCHCWRPDAISAVLCHYSGYITHMSLRTLHDEQGNFVVSFNCIHINHESGKRIVAPKARTAVKSKPNLLIDIQTKMQQANSPGFERWAKIFNLKEMAKTVMYLQENDLTDLGELEKACDATAQKFNDLSDQSKAASARMKDISELQKHIGAYGKTREIYAQYRKLTGSKREKFYEQHSSEITACQAAKRYFDSLGLKELPSMQSLKQEYAMLQAENKKRYPEYKQAREKMIELLTAKNNVARILGVTEKEKNRSRQQEAR